MWSSISSPTKVREKWGERTDDDFERIAGKKDELVGKLLDRFRRGG